jgi:hypothetical protein
LTGETLSIRLDPTSTSVALCRVFVGGVLGVAGAPDRDVDDVRIAVSDIATALVEAGSEIEIHARITDGEVSFEGNRAGHVPEAGALLLGDRMTLGDARWVIRVLAA